jgi:hypothetical protein
MTRFARLVRGVPWSVAAFIAGCLFMEPSFAQTPVKQRAGEFVALFAGALIAWSLIAAMTRGRSQQDNQDASWPGYPRARARTGRN